MSCRGVRFQVEFLDDECKKITIESARHSPLSIVKEQLSKLTGVSTGDMSLVLQDTTDCTDGILLTDDSESLYECGIDTGAKIWLSVLTNVYANTPKKIQLCGKRDSPPVSPLTSPFGTDELDESDGVLVQTLEQAAQRARLQTARWLAGDAWQLCDGEWQQVPAKKDSIPKSRSIFAKAGGIESNPEATLHQRTLNTNASTGEANHSYNGVVFDMSSTAPFEVSVTSIHIGGMLGRVNVFATGESWHHGQFERLVSRCGWNNSNNVLEQDAWVLVGSELLTAAWDGTRELKLDIPINIRPGATRGVYIHSGLPDDLGIQYQSYYSKDDVVGQDNFLKITPGIGHTGSEPFEHYHGWFRAIRGPCGSFSYTATRRVWDPDRFGDFPWHFRAAVRNLLLCHQKRDCVLSVLPLDLLQRIFRNCDWCWFDAADTIDRDDSSDDDEYAGLKQPSAGLNKLMMFYPTSQTARRASAAETARRRQDRRRADLDRRRQERQQGRWYAGRTAQQVGDRRDLLLPPQTLSVRYRL